MTTRPGPAGLGRRQISGSGPAGPAGTGAGTVAARRPPSARRWLAAGPPLLTLLLGLWGITGSSYWRDEAATLAATGRPFGRMIAMLGHVDAVHGAYYVLMWPVVRLGGTGELTTRLPSALAMAAATAGVVAIGQRLAGWAAGLVAGLVFAVLPEVSWFAQDARSYAIVTALAVAASYLLLRVLDSGGQRRWLLAYAAGLVVLGLFNIFSLLLVPAHAVTVALTARRRRSEPRWAARPGGRSTLLARWAAAAGTATVLVSPLFVAGWTQRQQISWIRPAGLSGALTVRLLIGPEPLTITTLLITACAVAGAAAGPGRLRACWPPRLLCLALPWALLPAPVLVAVSLVHPVWLFRYVVFCIPAVALLIGATVASLGRPAGAAALAVIVLLGLPMQVRSRQELGHGDGIRGVDRVLAAHEQPGDGVYWAQDGLRTLAAAYPYGLARLRDVALGQTAAARERLYGTNVTGVLLRRRLRVARRLWVVQIHKDGPVPLLGQLGFRLRETWRDGDLRLGLYARQRGGTA
ncbi:MAG TPA: glycosyltransferase family 39 protein [Streptosporangiaceae bacterium]